MLQTHNYHSIVRVVLANLDLSIIQYCLNKAEKKRREKRSRLSIDRRIYALKPCMQRFDRAHLINLYMNEKESVTLAGT